MNGAGREYASALFELAAEEGCGEEISRGLDYVTQVFRQAPEYADFLASPAVPMSERLGSVEEYIAGAVHPHVSALLGLMTRWNRIRDFDECAEEYALLYNASLRRAEAVAYSAAPLNDQEKKRLLTLLEKRSGRSVDIEYRIDKSLLGGVLVEMEGTRLDGSLRRRLQDIKDVINESDA